ncbi:hypothetical protein [Shewanella loihica]|uniref:hypothetical protein n=1 Tax=Shewanella loihica TaxID=359303 RepID=UPI00059E4EAA|nr:hypothetical protein [Shewanella loihica]
MSMDFIANIFVGIWLVGFITGLAAAIGLSTLHKCGKEVPFLLKYSGISVFFPKYYLANETRKRVVAGLISICVCCILLGLVWILITVPEAGDAIWNEVSARNLLQTP